MTELFIQAIPGLIAAAIGLVAGTGVALRMKKNAPSELEDESADDLDERLGHVMALLRDLVDQESRLDPTSYASERQRLEQRAAELLRARDAARAHVSMKKARPSETPTAVVGFLAARPGLRGFIWGGGTVGIVVLLFVLVSNESAPRPPMQGPMQAGPMQGPMQGEAGQSTAEIQSLVQHLTQNPSDVDALVRLGHLLLRGQMLHEAQVVTERALLLDPDNTEARVHAAVLKSAQDPSAGSRELDAIVKNEPSFSEAWLFRGMLAMRAGDTPRMQESFRRFVDTAPEGPQRDRIRAMLEGGATAPPAP